MQLKLFDFEGPFDLLLHLIKENKMDIFDIQMEVITKQYLAYIHTFERIDLEKTSAHLPLASELMEIKAKMLLPRQTEEEELEEDPREELVLRLLEYEAYKEITKTFKEKELDRMQIHTKLPASLEPYTTEEQVIEKEMDLTDLVEAFEKFLRRKEEEKPLHTKVTMKEITVSSRRLEITSFLKKYKKARFTELFKERSKSYIVATFLAILEMAREKQLKITQDHLFDEIIVEGI